ncbi:3-oxoacyl-(Acyl-carrier-protein) reductase [Cupriavidus necator]|uniref:3-oxoacyl-(Acyl-carrier-protein) reductase n=1 Tax=Cupriavidus necator TaxID=106590 RepID=A0A1K0IPP1_CUPNE|nr:3-oxoacyl-(Acyl-carrier-protein) reductase [Cupriavidus necator]
MQTLQGKVALVTGAGSGIGRANSVVMAARGAAIIVNDLGAASAQETVALIQQAGGTAVACIADVSDAASVERAFTAAQQALGPVDVLVNNAGIPGGMPAFEDIDEAAIDRMFNVTVKGAMLCTRVVLPGMKQRRSGRIINTSSITAFGSHRRGSVYAAAKGAIISLTRAWAREFAEWNILVNAVAPGRVQTPMSAALSTDAAYAEEVRRRVPLGRRALPEEIAAVVAFLASSDADYMTGQVLSPNGGEIM